MWETLVVAWRAIRFYAECIHWAAKDTLSRANATYGVVGVLLIYLAGRYWGLGTLHIPDDPPSNILFVLLALMVTWVVVFVGRLFGAPGRLYGDARDRIEFLTAQATPKTKVSLLGAGVQEVATRLQDGTSGPLSKWVQILVESTTNVALEDCEVYAISIARVNPNGSRTNLLFEPTFCEWSQESEDNRRRIRIPALVPHAANLFSVNDTSTPVILYLHFGHNKFQLWNEMQNPGKYIIEVVAAASNTASLKNFFCLNWGGSFADISFSLLDEDNH